MQGIIIPSKIVCSSREPASPLPKLRLVRITKETYRVRRIRPGIYEVKGRDETQAVYLNIYCTCITFGLKKRRCKHIAALHHHCLDLTWGPR